MDTFTLVTAFIIGLAIGSFINVISLRYDPNKGLFRREYVKGKSHCLYCDKALKWYELIPLVSFIIQGRKCRSCGKPLRWQYPIIELLTGVLAMLFILTFTGFELLIWAIALGILVLVTAIDFRLKIIPDEATIIIALLGVARMFMLAATGGFGDFKGSFSGHYAYLLRFRGNIAINHGFAVLIALIIFGGVILISKGRGMGMGDLKLALAAGLLIGWPDILLMMMIAFITGSLWGLGLIARGKKTLKSAIPFGPFIVLGIFVTVFFGKELFDWYFLAIDAIIS